MVTTRSRLPFSRVAAACFEAQSYPNRELVIVSTDLGSMAPGLNVPGARFFPASPDLLLGDLRNLSVQKARGQYVAIWDDDDWYHRDRLSLQLAAIGDRNGSTLLRMTFAWPSRESYFVTGEHRCEPTLLARRPYLLCYPYPSLPRGEDTEVISRLELARLDRPDLYVYNVHGGNTWPPEHFQPFLRRASRRLDPAEIAIVKDRLAGLRFD
jgi:glycosyltransferase involved in cell wall biosynthesis